MAGNKFLDVRDVDTFLKRPTAPPELSKKSGKLYNAQCEALTLL